MGQPSIKGQRSNCLTTALSQTTDILSSIPLVPSGIKVKLSFPMAFWAVEKLAWALEVTWRSPLTTHKTCVRFTCCTWTATSMLLAHKLIETLDTQIDLHHCIYWTTFQSQEEVMSFLTHGCFCLIDLTSFVSSSNPSTCPLDSKTDV